MCYSREFEILMVFDDENGIKIDFYDPFSEKGER